MSYNHPLKLAILDLLMKAHSDESGKLLDATATHMASFGYYNLNEAGEVVSLGGKVDLAEEIALTKVREPELSPQPAATKPTPPLSDYERLLAHNGLSAKDFESLPAQRQCEIKMAGVPPTPSSQVNRPMLPAGMSAEAFDKLDGEEKLRAANTAFFEQRERQQSQGAGVDTSKLTPMEKIALANEKHRPKKA